MFAEFFQTFRFWESLDSRYRIQQNYVSVSDSENPVQPDETRAESLTGGRSKAHALPASEATDFAVAGQALKPGMLVDRYKLIRKLGEGGFGVVFLASHKSFSSRRYALKLIRPDRLSTPELVSRFAKEIQAMEDLDHPNVVYAIDAGDWKGIQYLAMDFVDGFALDRLVGSSSLSIADACELIRQAAVGMQHVHEMGRTHRDIKPSNLMLDVNGNVRILDLGLAKLREDVESEQNQLTAAGQMMGTPDYMAPEQWEDSSTVDIRADIYSLGCSLFCLLAGQAPFSEKKSAIAKMRAHTSQDLPKIAELRDGISEDVVRVVQACLEKNHDARFAEPAELAEALTPFASNADLSKLLTSSGYSVVHPEITDQSTAVEAALADSTVVATEKLVSDQINSPPESGQAAKLSLRMLSDRRPGRSLSISLGIVAVLLIGLPVLYFGKFGNVPEIASTGALVIRGGHVSNQIAKNAGRIADTSEKTEKNTARIAGAVEKATENFAQLSKAGGTIENPVAPFEFYHNARIYELRGDYTAARRSYLDYFQFNEEKLDPYLRYLAFLKVQEGPEGARDTYAVVAGRAKGFIPGYASALLWDRDRRVELLEDFKKAQPDFAAVYYHLSLEFSAARLGIQSIADRQREKQYLEKFFEQDKAGQFVKFFIDHEMVTAWRGDATKRLEVANSVYGKMLENPVNLTWMNSNGGWYGYIAIAEPAQEIWWKTADMTDFRKNPKTQNIDQRTGKPSPSPSIALPIKQPATTVEVKYIDRTGAERGPFKFDFKPKVSQLRNEISILEMLRTTWISYRDYDGKLLVYFTTLMSYRGALTRIEFGIDKDVPDQEWGFPEWDKPGGALITKDVPTFRAIPKTTRFITVRLNFKDGTRTDVVKYPRQPDLPN